MRFWASSAVGRMSSGYRSWCSKKRVAASSRSGHRVLILNLHFTNASFRFILYIQRLYGDDLIMSSFVTNLNSSTLQEIVNWVTTADGCVHSADTTQLDFAVGKFVQTRRDCRQLVANCIVHTTDGTPLDSWVASVAAVCIGHKTHHSPSPHFLNHRAASN